LLRPLNGDRVPDIAQIRPASGTLQVKKVKMQ